MIKSYSVIIPDDHQESLRNHLLRLDGQEDLCFATYIPSTGRSRYTGIVTSLILPQEGERKVYGNVSFVPGYFERVMRIARKEGRNCILAFPSLSGLARNES